MNDCVIRPPAETIHRTPAALCPACRSMRQHTREEQAAFHPDAGHGCIDGKWTKPGLEGNR